MCIQRSTIFLIISLMVINSCNNQLLSADTADLKQKLPFDIFYVIFEHGTETTNQNLSRTCTTLNNLRRCYREDRSSAYNEKFKNKTCVYLSNDCSSNDELCIVDSILTRVRSNFFMRSDDLF